MREKVFFTSDTHFGHSNILKYTSRPFNSVEDMDSQLILAWNRVVPADGVVYHLGDVGFMPAAALCRVLDRLNGTIHLVYGNHDKSIRKSSELQSRFASLQDMKEVTISHSGVATKFVLCHFAMKVWNKAHHGAVHLYGHSHGTMPDDINSRSMDVGIDTHPELRPYSVREVLAAMKKKVFKPVDHHGTTNR